MDEIEGTIKGDLICLEKYLFVDEANQWYFSDESEHLHGPYFNILKVRQAILDHLSWLEQPKPDLSTYLKSVT